MRKSIQCWNYSFSFIFLRRLTIDSGNWTKQQQTEWIQARPFICISNEIPKQFSFEFPLCDSMLHRATRIAVFSFYTYLVQMNRSISYRFVSDRTTEHSKRVERILFLLLLFLFNCVLIFRANIKSKPEWRRKATATSSRLTYECVFVFVCCSFVIYFFVV